MTIATVADANAKRVRNLTEMSKCLNTPSGIALMAELESMWDGYCIQGKTPDSTAYNVGLRDAYKFLAHIKKGKFE